MAITETSPRHCKVSDCKRTLVHNNKTGFCTEHRVSVKARAAAARIRIVKQKAPEAQNDETKQTSRPAASLSLAATATVDRTRICEVPGCGRRLVWNAAGKRCNEHRPDRRALTKANGHANGAAVAAPAASAAHGHASVVERRVNLILAGIPLEDKLALINGWLAGNDVLAAIQDAPATGRARECA